ncbi:HDL118Cp [Eremothecium sinecaudum]|uniref:HDL118Cp n=1 Tax=Eremothecium sinecaudum TaxID=45286 RepID=A0A109UX15_9SACH|nr:HDL118Cp [Eremothecium sinecaudum]AMD20626.1 HDL118Cp [Eremothecium sinecaudum]
MKGLTEGLELADFVGATLRVQVSAERILEGVLVAIDHHCNQLLDKVKEQNKGTVRELGLVSVPWDSVMSIKISTDQIKEIGNRKVALSQAIV